jgi:hypothetical protein
MILYCWTIVTGATGVVPQAMGVAKDRRRAELASEPYLHSGEAFVSLIEAVRPAIAVHGLNPFYARTGVVWVGRRGRNGEVTWSRTLVRGTGMPLS